MKSIVIFKNDRIGDLIHSLESIYFIINNNKDKIIHIFISEYNYELKGLLDFANTKIYKISNRLKFKEKIYLIFFFLKNYISYTFILRAESFFFYLPLIFFYKNIEFNSIVIKNNRYNRPNFFLRKFLSNFVINDRGTKKIRKSILTLQNELVRKNSKEIKIKNFNENNHLTNFLPKDFIFFHFNRSKFNERGWDIDELDKVLTSLHKYKHKIVLSNDINDIKTNNILKNKYSHINHDKQIFLNKYVYYLPNIQGEDFFNTIKKANLVIAFHGSITAIGALNNRPVLDIFHTNIKTRDDFYKYKNSFHEFKFKKNNYEFIIPKNDINKTINKINWMIKNGTKINIKNF